MHGFSKYFSHYYSCELVLFTSDRNIDTSRASKHMKFRPNPNLCHVNENDVTDSLFENYLVIFRS